MSYWAEFARTGKPGRGGRDLPEWTAWNGEQTHAARQPGGRRRAHGRSGREARADPRRRRAGPRLPERWQRCAVYHDLACFSRGFDKKDYWQVADGACASFPLEQYPWGKM